MAWIESHQALEKHPKILHLSTVMGWSIDETLGKVHRFWWWCLDYAPTGNLVGIDPVTLAKGLSLTDDDCHKFMPALMTTHLVCRLTRTRLPWRVHDWIDYAGRYLRDTKFKRSPEKWAQVVELYTTTCQPTVSRLSADMSGKKSPHVSRLSAVPTNQPNQPTNQPTLGMVAFEEFYSRYPKHDGKEPARKAWDKLRVTTEMFEVICAALDRQRASDQWQRENGKFIPLPATWLNQQRWNDEGVTGACRSMPKSMVDLL